MTLHLSPLPGPSLAAMALVALALTAHPLAAAPTELAFEDAEGRQVMFTFAEDRAAPDALVIETRRFGNPGAAIMIWIDQSTDPLATMILDAGDCSYNDDGAACRLAVAGDSADYVRFVEAFRLGRTAHVEVRNANLAEMRDDVPLDGFAAAYDR
jgi:hypothetical protein